MLKKISEKISGFYISKLRPKTIFMLSIIIDCYYFRVAFIIIIAIIKIMDVKNIV